MTQYVNLMDLKREGWHWRNGAPELLSPAWSMARDGFTLSHAWDPLSSPIKTAEQNFDKHFDFTELLNHWK